MPAINDRITRTNRQTEALERQAKSAGLSVKARIALLDKRLGKGVGATRERAKLAA